MIEIDKNIPVPPKLSAVVRKLRKNESVFVPGKKPSEVSGCVQSARKLKRKFTMRSVEERGITGTRIWRTK